MAFFVTVKVKGGDEITGPSTDSKEEAESQLAEIKSKLGSYESPDLPWLAVQGKDVLSAHVSESMY